MLSRKLRRKRDDHSVHLSGQVLMEGTPRGSQDRPAGRGHDEEPVFPPLPRGFGFPGAVMLSWMIAGGLLAGGFLVAYGTLTERVSGRALLHTAGGLYIIGAFIGGILGGALGMFGRPLEMAARRAFRDQLVALLYSLPALFIAFVVTGWIAMTVVAISLGEVLPLVGVSTAYLISFVAVGVALRFGRFGARTVRDRAERHHGRERDEEGPTDG